MAASKSIRDAFNDCPAAPPYTCPAIDQILKDALLFDRSMDKAERAISRGTAEVAPLQEEALVAITQANYFTKGLVDPLESLRYHNHTLRERAEALELVAEAALCALEEMEALHPEVEPQEEPVCHT